MSDIIHREFGNFKSMCSEIYRTFGKEVGGKIIDKIYKLPKQLSVSAFIFEDLYYIRVRKVPRKKSISVHIADLRDGDKELLRQHKGVKDG